MRRAARPLLYLGIAAVVVGLSKYHAGSIGHYDFTNSSRFAWAIVLVATHAVVAYAVGLPDLPRTRKLAIVSSLAATFAATAIVSFVQLFAGDALLPRFVVFGA